jgi:hypothetical protein
MIGDDEEIERPIDSNACLQAGVQNGFAFGKSVCIVRACECVAH